MNRLASIEGLRLALGLAALAALGGCGAGAGPPVPVAAVELQILAQDTAWSASYALAGPDGAALVPTGREVHLPLGAEVELALSSREFICLFSMPGLGFRDFAAPGLPAKFHFHADKIGSYDFRSDELCGRPHTDKARGRFIVENPSAFRAWVHEQMRKAKK